MMPLQITDIDGDAHQRHTILLDDSEVVLSLRFHPTVEMWVTDVEYGGRKVSGVKLSVGVMHMRSQNFPFDIVVTDNTGQGLDPLRLDDFESGRCSLYVLNAADMEVIRGQPVPL